MKRIALPWLILSCGFLVMARAEERTWTSTDGRTLLAELISYDLQKEEVKIKNARGEYTLAFSKISPADQEYVRNLAAEEKAKEVEMAKKIAELAGKTTKMETGKSNSYHVYYPKSFSLTKKPPMMILFSTFGNGRDAMRNFMQGADELGWVLVGCDQLKNGMPAEEGDPIFEDLLPHIEAHVIHDPELLYLGGMSGAALRSYIYSAQYDRPWKGIVACGGWLGGSSQAKREYRKKMAVAIVNGDQDKNANAYLEGDTKLLKGRGCKVEWFSFPGGHVVGPPELIAKAMKWVQENSQKSE